MIFMIYCEKEQKTSQKPKFEKFIKKTQSLWSVKLCTGTFTNSIHSAFLKSQKLWHYSNSETPLSICSPLHTTAHISETR